MTKLAAILVLSVVAACAGSDAGSTGGGSETSPKAVNLGAAGGYAILAKSAVSTVPTSAITGNVGVCPVTSSYVTGFSLTGDATHEFATSPQVTGKVYAADYSPPTPSNLTTAVGDMRLAYTDAADRAPDVTDLGDGDIGGRTLPRGVYRWSAGLLIPSSVTLSGSATDVWIFQIGRNLTVSGATSVVLTGGAVARNVFWQISGGLDLGTTAHFEGVVLAQTAVTLRAGASMNGTLLTQAAVHLDASTVVQPARGDDHFAW